MINLLIADNQVLTREGIRAMLSGIVDIHIDGIASNSAELEELLIGHKPKVLIIDPGFNNRFTIEHLQNIVRKFSYIRVLVLSNRQNKQEVQEIIDLGIKNFVFKECSREEFVHAIYSTAKGEQFFCKNTFETLFGNKLIADKDDPAAQLSSRETELIHLISEGLTNKEIAEKLFLSIHTIKTHRKNIIKKLGFTFKNTAEFASLIQKR